MAAVVRGWENTSEEEHPARRRRLDREEFVPQSILLLPVQLTDVDKALNPCVLMSELGVKMLFCRADKEDVGEKYVKVARNVYRVAICQLGIGNVSPQEPMLYLDSVQFSECQAASVRIKDLRYIQVSSFDPHQVSRAKSVDIEIEFFSTVSPQEHLVLPRDHLDQIVRDALKDTILTKHQQLLLQLPTHTFKMKIKKIEGPDREEGPFSDALLLNPTLAMCFVHRETQFHFSMKRHPKVSLVESIVDASENRDISFNFNLRMSRAKQDDRESMVCDSEGVANFIAEQTYQNRPSVFVDIAELQKAIQQQVSWVQGQKIQVTGREKDTVELTLEQAEYIYPDDEESSLPPAKERTRQVHHHGYKIGEKSWMSFECSQEIILVDSTVPCLTPAAMRIDIKVFRAKQEKKDGFLAIDVEELQVKMQRLGKPWSVGEVLAIKIEAGICLLEVSQVTDLSQTEHRVSSSVTKSLSHQWMLQKETKFVFTCSDQLGVPLVEMSQTVVVKKLVLNVSTRGPQRAGMRGLFEMMEGEEKNEVITEKELRQLVTKHMPKMFARDTTFTTKLSRGAITTDVRFSVESFDYNLKDGEIFTYNPVGCFSDGIELEFRNFDGDKSVLIEKESPFESRPSASDCLKLGIGGLSEQVHVLFRNLVLSRKPDMRSEMQRRGIAPAKGALLCGPPGTGKTTLARQLAKLLGCDSSRVSYHSGSEFWTKWIGDTETKIRAIFAPAKEAAEKYGEKSPLYVVVIDEIDALVSARTSDSGTRAYASAVGQMLTCLDGLAIMHNLIVIGITNRKDVIDPAVLRPGRLGLHLEISLPNQEQRIEIFDVHTSKLRSEKILAEDVDLATLATMTEGLSGADIEAIVQTANSYALERLSMSDTTDPNTRIKEGTVTMTDLLKACETKDKAPDLSYYS